MKLNDYLHTNEKCPVCGEPLKLYMQVTDGPLWKSSQVSSDTLIFEKNTPLAPLDGVVSDDYFWINRRGDDYNFNFSGSSIFQHSKTWSIFFFYLCNEKSIENKYGRDYEIDPYRACYFRSCPFMEFGLDNKAGKWALELASGADAIDGNTRDEICIFKIPQENGLEKVYILSLDYEFKVTTLRFFKTTAEDRVSDDFEPKVFKKELPLLGARPNFDISERDKLIDRLNSWIIMS